MKRLIAVLLSAGMILSLAACGSDSSSSTTESTASSAVESAASEDAVSSEESTAAEDGTESSAAESSDAYAGLRDQINSQAEESDAEAGETSSSKIKNEYDSVYLEWKYSNWESASEEDRIKCCKSYMGYIGDLMSARVTEADLADEQITKIYSALEKVMKNNPDYTVQEIVLYTLSSEASSSESSTEASE